MYQLIAVIQKEILLLLRDRMGLLMLFVMPAALVIVITLVQENAIKSIGAGEARILLIDYDGQATGRRIGDTLEDAEGVHVIRSLNGKPLNRERALILVAEGDYQVCLILPPGLTCGIRNRARRSAMESLSEEDGDPMREPVPTVEIYFDPTTMGAFRSAVRNLLDLAVFQLEVGEKFTALAGRLPEQINRSLAEALEPVADMIPHTPQVTLPMKWSDLSLMRVEERPVLAKGYMARPTSVQQNVPAWSLFGVFFIVLPMAGAFIQERNNGTRMRLQTMPVRSLTLVSGRVITYAGICTLQCALIGGIGMWVLPLWGTPALEMNGTVAALLVMVASAVLAAAGYGILLGTVVNTFQQAAMFGPLSIVITAALGGIMVPVYAMPAFMQKLSLISPLGWGLNGSIDIFVRGGELVDVLPEACSLIFFFFACLFFSWYHQHHHDF